MPTPQEHLDRFFADAKIAFELAEVEMRYAGWGVHDLENVGRRLAYDAVCKALAHMQEPKQ